MDHIVEDGGRSGAGLKELLSEALLSLRQRELLPSSARPARAADSFEHRHPSEHAGERLASARDSLLSPRSFE
jgi:hypothetical protein